MPEICYGRWLINQGRQSPHDKPCGECDACTAAATGVDLEPPTGTVAAIIEWVHAGDVGPRASAALAAESARAKPRKSLITELEPLAHA